VTISGINFYSIYARDFPQKEGFERGGIKDCCFLPVEEIGESLPILEGVCRALCVRMLCLDDVEKFVVSNVAGLEKYNFIMK